MEYMKKNKGLLHKLPIDLECGCVSAAMAGIGMEIVRSQEKLNLLMVPKSPGV